MVILKNLCPVCGYGMDDPPRDYNICPSCGTEFGLHDANASIANLRSAWLATGPKWWSPTDSAPTEWRPLEQVQRVMTQISGDFALDFSAPAASGSLIIFEQMAPAKFQEPADIQYAVGYLYKTVPKEKYQTSTLLVPVPETASG